MKKTPILLLALFMTTSCIAFAAKYTVNSSGTVKNQAGTIITSPANSINQNFYPTQNYNLPSLNQNGYGG